MYVCIEVALRGMPMERGDQLGLGRDPQEVQCPNPAGTNGPVSPMLTDTRTFSAFCSQLCSGQLRVGGNRITVRIISTYTE